MRASFCSLHLQLPRNRCPSLVLYFRKGNLCFPLPLGRLQDAQAAPWTDHWCLLEAELLDEDNRCVVDLCKNLLRCTLSARPGTRARSWEMVSDFSGRCTQIKAQRRPKSIGHLQVATSTFQHQALTVPCATPKLFQKQMTPENHRPRPSKDQIDFRHTQNIK